MQHTILLLGLLLAASSIVLADEPLSTKASTNASTNAAVRVGVIRKEDLRVIRKFRGRSIPDGPTTHLLSTVMLRIYRATVENNGDGKIPFWQIHYGDEAVDLVLEIRPFDRGPNTMSLGSSLYTIHFILHSMLHPQRASDGFRELEWQIIDKAITPGYEIPLGTVSLRIEDADELKEDAVKSISTAQVNSTTSPSTSLSENFPVAGTDVILVIRDLGANVPIGELVLTMHSPIIKAWRDVAINHRVLPVRREAWFSPFLTGLSVVLRPRMIGTKSQMTDTDLVEALTGYIYYCLHNQPCTAANFTIVRPDSGGTKIAVGDVEVRSRDPRLQSAGSGDDGQVDVS
ncbi:MAG: hypothetical protein L6R35_005318 [Caloplaca aegaea]|nr:MAG: hypothetical protein L6R35_005318 [Caloplaca aegaea]